MLTIFLRAILLYLIMLMTLRAMGKHQLGQFQPYEFALAIIIADLMATPMSDISIPMLHGVMPVAALFIVHCLLTLACMRSDKLRAFISGKPSVVVSRGVVDKKELTRLCLSLSDLLEGMRQSGILDPSQMETAVIEANGRISAFTSGRDRAASPADLSIPTDYEGMPMTLIMDGRVQQNNLKQAERDLPWLEDALKMYNLSTKDVLLMSLGTNGKAYMQDMRGATIAFEAMKPEEVCW